MVVAVVVTTVVVMMLVMAAFFDRYCFCDFQHSYGRRFIEFTVIGCMCLLRGLSVRLVGSRILGS